MKKNVEPDPPPPSGQKSVCKGTSRAGFRATFQAWWQASRPPFYIATLVPLFLGFIKAGKDTGVWQPWQFALILLCCFFLHLAANLANDVFDHLQGVDDGDNIGGSRALQEGKISLGSYAKALALLYGASLLLALAGVLRTGLPAIWGIVVFAMASSFFYVAPPIKYGHRALGEVMVFINMGLVMTCGTYYVLTGTVTLPVFTLSLPVGLMVAGILYYQSLPEIETDKTAGKRTLANTLGPEKAIRLFRCWWPVIYALLLLLVVSGVASWTACIGIAASLPFYRKTLRYLEDAGGDWLSLDAYGHLVRKMYLLCGVFLIVAVARA